MSDHPPKTPGRGVVPPLMRAVTYRFESAAELEQYNRGERPELSMYSRYDNPTVLTAERELAALQGAEDAALFASGMAAATTALLAYLRAGDEVVSASAIYGGVFKFLRDVAPQWGIGVRFVDGSALAKAETLSAKTRVLYFETPVNPTLRLVEAAPIVRNAAERGAVTMVDSTFAPPVIQDQRALGTDLVIHSVTKYLNGHSDVLGGVVFGSRERLAPVKALRKILGGTMDPSPAWELMRSLKTLEVRFARQQATAAALAERLSRDPRVVAVSYPGLESHPDHALAKKQQRGFGAMVTFTVPGGYAAASRLYDALGTIERAASLGSVESLCSLPAITSHVGLSADELNAAGVDPGMVRLSVGLEPVEALWADLDRALGRSRS